ncbi:uncharacterized transmembrane protein DDB_G0289901-like isoform X1 [Folsomia candida]|nr:uncharacterized transmembrane protein DDB_G0289901-like isoform X1 [Folsomia candida]
MVGKQGKVLGLCVLLVISSVQGRTVVNPNARGGGADPRDLWGLVNVWEGDDTGNVPPELCNQLKGHHYPPTNILQPNQWGGYPGNSLPYRPPRPDTPGGGGYTEGIHSSNEFGGFAPVSAPYIPRPAVDPGYVPRPAVDQPYVPRPAVDPGYVPRPAVDQPYVPRPAVDQPYVPRPAVDPGYVQRPSVESGYVQRPAIVPGVPSYLATGGSSAYNQAQNSAEHTAFEQNKQSSSQSSGSSNNYYGAANGGMQHGFGGNNQFVSAQGNQFQTSDSSKESNKFESQKQSNSASSGQTGAYYGATGVNNVPYRPYGQSQVVAAEGSQFQMSNSNKESIKAESQKESSSASSGQTGAYYGAAGGYNPYRPSGASQVVAAEGSQFQTSDSSKESTKFESDKQSSSASSGQTGAYYGATGVNAVPNRPYGASQVVAAEGSQFQTSDSSKESIKSESNKESSSASSGQTGAYYGATGVNAAPYRPYGASQVVAAEGAQFQTSDSSKESTKFESDKQSSSASSGQTGAYYGATGVNAGSYPTYEASQVVAAEGAQFQTSNSNKESIKSESSKESASASSGQTGAYYGATGVNSAPYRPYGASQVVAAEGAQFQTSDSNKESTKFESNKESASASSGQTGAYYGATGVNAAPYRPYGASQVVAAEGAQFQTSDSSKESIKSESNKESASASSGQTGSYYGATGGSVPYAGSQIVAAEGAQFQNSASSAESTKLEQSKEHASSSSGSQGQFVSAETRPSYFPQQVSAGQASQFQTSDSSKESSKFEQNKASSSSSSGSEGAYVAGVNGGYGNSGFVSAGQGSQFQNSASSSESIKSESSAEHSTSASGSNSQFVAAADGGGSFNPYVAGAASSGTNFETSSVDKELTKFDAEKSSSSSSQGSSQAYVGLDRPESAPLVAAGSNNAPVFVSAPHPEILRYDCTACRNNVAPAPRWRN